MEKGTIELRTIKDWIWLGLYEYIGTTIFLFGINFSSGSAGLVALSLFIACIITARIGGGHFNGGVTLAVYLVEGQWKKNLPIAVLTWIVDLLGAYTGIGLAAALQQTAVPFVLKPRDDKLPLFHVFFEEFMFSTIFIGVILHTKYSKIAATKDGMLGALTVAITLYAMASMVGADSGGCFNPTIGVSETTYMLIVDYAAESSYSKYITVYLFGPLCGAVLAACYTYFVALRVPLGDDVEIVKESRDEAEYRKESHEPKRSRYNSTV